MFKKVISSVIAILILSGAGTHIMRKTRLTAGAETEDIMTYGVENVMPTAGNDLSNRLIRSSALAVTDDGYMRIFCMDGEIWIEYYDDGFNIISKNSIPLELDIWGGFYAGNDAYYLVEGQNNTAEDDSAEVIRVIKYDKDWNRLGAAKITPNTAIFGGEMRYPFNYGGAEMTEHDGTLYIVSGHEGYVDDAVGQGHQGFIMVAVDEAAMTGKIIDSDLYHSFAQYITLSDNRLYVSELSEGSYGTNLTRYELDDLYKNSSSTIFGTHYGNVNMTNIRTLEYGGQRTSAWAIPTYVTVNGVEASKNNVFCLGSSIDQEQYDSYTYDMAYNIYLTVTPKSDFSEGATKLVWLTDYEGDGRRFTHINITKINDDQFLVMWEENDTKSASDADVDLTDALSEHTLHYIFIDGDGNKIGKEFTAAAAVSQCKPVLNGSVVSYCASNGSMVNFYSIDSASGKFSKEVYRLAGGNVTWDLSEDGTLTISGTGEISGEMPWGHLSDSVNKIRIKSGITDIGVKAFTGFSELEEIYIEDGVRTIGDQAFAFNYNLKKVTIPSSVKSIGEDILWTGYYWIGDHSHVINASIYLDSPDSYAAEYAEKNGIRYGTDISKAKIVGLKDKYEYDMGMPDPEFKVMLGDKELIPDTDYDYFYSFDKDGLGKVTLEIYGKGDGYAGELTASYEVIAGDISKYICILGFTEAIYTGEPLRPLVSLKKSGGDYSSYLSQDTDYTVTYEDNNKPGTAKAIIKGIGNYKGTVTAEFTIIENTGGSDGWVEWLFGDVNGDGTIDISDVSTLINHLNGVKALGNYSSLRADVDRNWSVDIEDAAAIVNHINGVKALKAKLILPY